jgi:hypothetical protein
MSEKDKGLNEGNEMKKKEQGVKNKKEKSRKTEVVALIIFLILFIPWLYFGGLARTSPIGGKIIDAETKKPIPNARIKVEWTRVFPFWIDPGKPTFKEKTYKSNEKGEFYIFRVFQPVYPGTIFYEQRVLIYAHGYKAISFSRENTPSGIEEHLPENIKAHKLSSTNTIIELKPLKTAEEWAENLNSLKYDHLDPDENPDEQKFIEEEREYGKKFFK